MPRSGPARCSRSGGEVAHAGERGRGDRPPHRRGRAAPPRDRGSRPLAAVARSSTSDVDALERFEAEYRQRVRAALQAELDSLGDLSVETSSPRPTLHEVEVPAAEPERIAPPRPEPAPPEPRARRRRARPPAPAPPAMPSVMPDVSFPEDGPAADTGQASAPGGPPPVERRRRGRRRAGWPLTWPTSPSKPRSSTTTRSSHHCARRYGTTTPRWSCVRTRRRRTSSTRRRRRSTGRRRFRRRR